MDIRLEQTRNDYVKSYKIMDSDKKVGQLSISIHGQVATIEGLTIHQQYRQRGIATKVVSILKEEYSNLFGESTPFAIEFWIKMGARFDSEMTPKKVMELLETGEYATFRISR